MGNGYTIRDGLTWIHFLRKGYENRAAQLGSKIPSSEISSNVDKLLEELIIETSKELLAPSLRVWEDLVKLYGIRGKNISVIHHGVEISEFSVATAKEKERARILFGLGQGFVVGFIGPGFRKGLQYLLRALPNTNGRVHVLVSNVSGEEKAYYKRIASDLGVSQRVQFLDFVTDMSLFYNALDAFCLPTIYDPFSLAGLEAMASGLPIIISTNAGLSEKISSGKNGLIIDQVSDSNRLTELIELVQREDGLREELGRRARETAEESTWDVVAAKVIGEFG